MDEERIVWALLAPLAAGRLEEEAAAFRRERLGPGDKYLPPWETRAGAGDYSALVNRNPGTRHVHEGPLAERLSRARPAPVYVVYVDAESFGSEGVETYEGGRYTGDVEADPYEFARRLGCPLAGSPSFAHAPGPVRSVAVVEGVGAGAVARALGFDAPPQSDSLSVEDGPVGAVVHSRTLPDLSMLTYKLSAAFPDRDVYKLSTGPAPGRFLVWVVRDGRDAGVFEHPAAARAAAPPLDSVKGRTTPEGIAEALGVTPAMLGLGER